MAKKASAEDLLDLIEDCTAATLEELDGKIATLEKQRDETLAKLDRTLEALKSVRKIVNIKLHGKPPRKKPVRKKKGEGQEEQESGARSQESEDGGEDSLVDRIFNIVHEKGPLGYAQIGNHLGVHHTSIRHAVNRSTWFEVNAGVVSIARAE
jgi:hypothetical protein